MLNFEKTAKAYYQKLYAFAYHLCGNQADAEDLTQHTFYRLALNIHTLKKEEKARSWLYSTLYRKFIDQHRRIVKFPTVEFDENDSTRDYSEEQPEYTIDYAALTDCIRQLDEPLRVVITLFYIENYSYKEIARMLDLPIGTVMSRLYRAKTKLHKKLTPSLKTAYVVQN